MQRSGSSRNASFIGWLLTLQRYAINAGAFFPLAFLILACICRERHPLDMGISSIDFDNFLKAVHESTAHSKLCEEVYGTNLEQLNLLDHRQLSKLIDKSDLKAGKQFLDLGCGLGQITQHIASCTGANGLGIDFAQDTIGRLQSKPTAMASYQVADLNALSFTEKFDAILAIDALYFASDLKKTLSDAFNGLKPGGRFLAFYSQRPKASLPDDIFEAHSTVLGRALNQIGVQFESEDFSQEEILFWKKMDRVLEYYKPLFQSEGNESLYKDRREETDGALSFIQQGKHCRYLYLVSAPK